MGNILFHVDHKLHSKNCNMYSPLVRLYIRKSTKPRTEKDERTGELHSYGQRFIGRFWLCTVCGLFIQDVTSCKKCESENIAMGKSDKWGERDKTEYRHCLDCKYSWKVKFSKVKASKLVIT